MPKRYNSPAPGMNVARSVAPYLHSFAKNGRGRGTSEDDAVKTNGGKQCQPTQFNLLAKRVEGVRCRRSAAVMG